jgi:hypothetical protein
VDVGGQWVHILTIRCLFIFYFFLPCGSTDILLWLLFCLEYHFLSHFLYLTFFQNDVNDIPDLTFSMDADEEKHILYGKNEVCKLQVMICFLNCIEFGYSSSCFAFVKSSELSI